MNIEGHKKPQGLKPKPCCICQELFQPFTRKQKTCGKPKCRRQYENEKSKEYYHRKKEEQKDIHRYLTPDKPRRFHVDYLFVKGEWFWNAVGDNGCKLSNGPFETIEMARKDYESAI